MSEYLSTITISFSNLWVLKTSDNNHYPLEMFVPTDHIHGELRIQINEQVVPHMSYFGSDDVCFDIWIRELAKMRKRFKGNVQDTYIFDEGEQGQPAYRFVRDRGDMHLSIVDSEFSGGHADPKWQNVIFEYKDFVKAYEGFRVEFLAEITQIIPSAADHWAKLFE